jgi:hypothetical protein
VEAIASSAPLGQGDPVVIDLLIILALTVTHAFAVLIGNGLITRAQDERDRRQAAAQREINGK